MGSPKKTVTADVKVSEPRLPRAGVSVDAASGDSLHDSQLHFSYLAEATSAGIFILDGMIIRYANPAATLLTGYALEELLNKPFWELADPAYGEVLKRQGLRQFDESIPTRFEIKMITKKGQERWIDLTAGITEDNGRPSTVVTAFDITERDLAEKAMQQAQETANAERQRLNDVLEALPAYLILLTPDYHVSFANRFFRERFGESNGRRCYEYLFNRGEPCENCETFKVLSEGLSSYHWEWLGPDGHYYDIYDFPFVDIDGTKLIMEMGIDITERKQAESELQRYQLHLEDRVNERTEELRIANSQLESEIAERQQIEHALIDSNQRLTLMAEVTSELLATDEPQQLVEDLCRKVLEYLDCQVFVNFLVDEEHHRLELNACAGVSEEEAQRIHWLDFGVAVCGCVARDGKRIVAENIQYKKDPRTDLVRSWGIKAYACHPLVANGQVIGTLSFGTRSRSRFSADDLSLMKTVTDQVAIAMQRKRMEQTLRESERRFRIVLEHTPIVVANLDRDLNYTWIYNPQVGLSAQDIVGKKVGLATGPENAERLQTELRKVVDQGVSVQVEVSSNLDAQVSHFEVHGEPLRDGDGNIIGVALVSIDVTRRKQTNEELRRLNRTLKALSSSNQAMLYAVSEMDYLNEVCRIIVEDCGHAMVWIGFAEDDAQKSVRPVASAGFEAGYLEALKISWADNKYGRGPTGTAIRTGKPNRCDDMLKDPRYAPWREQALKRGYASSIVLPLLKGKKAFGALNIYSRQPYGFSDQEENLLIELANDLAYGISSIRVEELRARTEDALVRSEARYRGLFDHMSEGFALHEIICDEDNRPVDYRFIEINESFERLTGLKRELAHGKLVSEVIPNLEPYWIQAYGEVALTGQPAHIENYAEALGRYFDVYVYSPNPRQFATIFTDVTERKQSETRLEYLASFPERNPNPVVEVDFDGHVRYVNPASRRIFPDLEEKGPAHDWLADWENIVLPFRQGHIEMIVRDVTMGKRTYQQSLNPLLKEGLIRIYGLDITQRKQAESEVLQERLKLQKIFDVVNVGLLLVAPDGTILRANEVAAQWTTRKIPEMVGLQPGDALGCINALNNPQGCGHHANCQACRIRNSFEAVLQSGLPVHGIETENILYLRGEEHDIWLSVSADPIEIDGQQNVILALNDITPVKQAENALRQAHDLLELRVQQRTEELAIANTQLRAEVEAREVAQERLEANMQELEVAEEELRENNSALLVAHQQLEEEVIERRKTQEELQASLQELQVIEEELRNNNDMLVEAQRGLEAEHQRYRDLFEFAPDGYLVTDKFGSVQEANQVITKMLGISQRHLLKKPLRVFVDPHDYPLYNKLIVDLNHKSSIQKREINLLTRKGELIPASITVSPAVNAKGAVSLRWMIRDISELKQAETAIKENAARAAAQSEISKSLAEASLDESDIFDIVVKTTTRLIGDSCVVALVSEDGQWLDPVAWDHHQPEALALMNDLYRSVRRPAPEGLAGQVFTTSQTVLIKELGMPAEDIEILPAYRAYLERVGISSLVITPLRIGNQTIGTFGLTRDRGGLAYTPEDQGLIEVLASRTAQAVHNARLYQDLQNALRQEQEVRDQLVQTEKFAVAGRMLASITHEINNPLQTIKNCLYLIRADTPEETPISDLLGMASSETNRMSNLVAQLRTIYHPPTKEQGRPVYLPALLNDVKALMAGHFQEKHVIWDMNLQKTEGFADYTVLGISDKLKQVFLNISLNAAEAMQPDGGRLMVDLILPDDLDQVGVRFKDTGPGLSPEVQDKLFEPFVTTKENGLGLGLAICYNIVNQHNGHIDVNSQIGEGATFTIWLPVVKEINEPS